MNKYVYLGIGTNLANRRKNIQKAIHLLDREKGIRVIKISSVYETPPWGYVRQNGFYNAVVKIETKLKPEKLLSVCQHVEKRMARIKKFKWGPRIVDIDILIYKEIKKYTKKLTIPHKYITQRMFTLVPLAEIDENIKLNGQRIDYFINRLNQEIKPV